MAHTEEQIRRAIKPLLSIYGELDTSEVKKLLHTVLKFDKDDELKSNSRNETKIIQKIGNIVSHQEKQIEKYQEGFLVDKSKKPAHFILLNQISEKPINAEEIGTMKNKVKSFVGKFVGKRVDWERLRDRNNEIGDQGEEFVMEFECDRLAKAMSKTNAEVSEYVSHLSRLQGDGLGYDILSINAINETDDSLRYIEVKTTSQNFTHPFYMSRNERNFFEEYPDSAYIYRVYNFDRNTRHGEVKIISQSDLFNNFIFDSITWKVSPKMK